MDIVFENIVRASGLCANQRDILTDGGRCRGPAHRSGKKILDDGVPRGSDIVALITPATRGEHTAVPKPLGEMTQIGRGASVRGRRKSQMGQWVAGDAVCSGLQDDELGRKAF
jgi:hypothetical protein